MNKKKPFSITPLTQKQYTFCSEYIKNGFNAYDAALKAGYSESYAAVGAHSLVTQPLLRERIEKAYAKAEDRLTISWEWKLKKLERVVEAFIPDDRSIELNSRDVKVAITALAELNRMAGDYAPEKRLSMTVDATQERLNEARLQYKEY